MAPLFVTLWECTIFGHRVQVWRAETSKFFIGRKFGIYTAEIGPWRIDVDQDELL